MRDILNTNFFKDDEGNTVIAQKPNASIILAGTLWVAVYLTNGSMSQFLRVGFYAAISYWAMQEIVNGANNFRRLLGIIVLIATVLSILKIKIFLL